MAYKTPGVYIKEISKFPPSVAEVETAIPAFIGYTEIAKKETDDDLLRVPTRITSMVDYEALFGGARTQEFSVIVDEDDLPESASVSSASAYRMYYALRSFFDNGGGPCYIVSAGHYTDAIDRVELGKSATSTPGGLDLVKKIDEVTLIYFPDAPGLTAPQFYGLYADALDQSATLQDRFAILDLKRDGSAASNPVNFLRGASGIGTSNLKYGAAYWPWLITTMNYEYDDGSVTFSQPDDGTGSAGPLDAVTLLAALADAGTSPLITDEFLAKLKEVINKNYIEMPPGAAIAGVYATVDRTRGVWKAPANVSLKNVIGPTVKINDSDQADLNVHTSGKSINAIRSFTGKGVMVWGARTLSGNDNEWRYVSVRRFFNMAEESVKKATEPFVFEPNDSNTWVKVRAMIENFLVIQWRQGALAGAKPDDAFYVKVGLGETMTALDILEGRMNVEIGMAVVRPAEFIILKFSHKMQES